MFSSDEFATSTFKFTNTDVKLNNQRELMKTKTDILSRPGGAWRDCETSLGAHSCMIKLRVKQKNKYQLHGGAADKVKGFLENFMMGWEPQNSTDIPTEHDDSSLPKNRVHRAKTAASYSPIS